MSARGIGLHALVVAENEAIGLDALRKVRALRVGEAAPAADLESAPRFVAIEPA